MGEIEVVLKAATLGTVALSAGRATFTTNGLIAGDHTLTAVYTGDLTNAPSTSSALTQIVNKGTPSVTTWPTALAIASGQTLADYTLSGGAATPDGSFTWATPNIAPSAGTNSHSVTFTPTDTTNYHTASSTVSYAYHDGGEVSSMSSIGGTVSYALDAGDRLSAISSPAGNFNYSYNANNGLLAGVACAAGGVSVAWS